MQHLVSLKTKDLATHLGFYARSNGPICSAIGRGLFLLMVVFMLCGIIVGQDRKTQEEAAKRLMVESVELVNEGSPTSLTRAIEKLESARTVLQTLNLPAGEGAMLSLLGYVYNQLAQNAKAIEKYEQSLVLFRAAGEKKGEATSLVHLGLIHSAAGELEKARDNFVQAALLFDAVGDRQGQGMALSSLASLHGFLGKPEESLTFYTKALEIFRTKGFREGEAIVLTALGPLYTAAGQTQMAQKTMEKALSISRAANYRQGQAGALLALGFSTLINSTYKRHSSFTNKLCLSFEQSMIIWANR